MYFLSKNSFIMFMLTVIYECVMFMLTVIYGCVLFIRFGRSTVVALESRVETYEKQMKQLKKALERSDTHIEHLEQLLKEASGKTHHMKNSNVLKPNVQFESKAFEELPSTLSGISDIEPDSRSAKQDADSTFNLELPSPMLKGRNNSESNTMELTIDDSKNDTFPVPSPTVNVKKRLRFATGDGETSCDSLFDHPKAGLDVSMTPELEDCMKILEAAERKLTVRHSLPSPSVTAQPSTASAGISAASSLQIPTAHSYNIAAQQAVTTSQLYANIMPAGLSSNVPHLLANHTPTTALSLTRSSHILPSASNTQLIFTGSLSQEPPDVRLSNFDFGSSLSQDAGDRHLAGNALIRSHSMLQDAGVLRHTQADLGASAPARMPATSHAFTSSLSADTARFVSSLRLPADSGGMGNSTDDFQPELRFSQLTGDVLKADSHKSRVVSGSAGVVSSNTQVYNGPAVGSSSLNSVIPSQNAYIVGMGGSVGSSLGASLPIHNVPTTRISSVTSTRASNIPTFPANIGTS